MAASGQERLRLEGVCKSFRAPVGAVPVAREVNLSLAAGEFGVITGPSDRAKTTLLTGRGLLQDADAEDWLDAGGVRLGEGERRTSQARGGMVFQKVGLCRTAAAGKRQFRFRYWRRTRARRG
jgi:ABC-type lipoprotein export system ATPase subunit